MKEYTLSIVGHSADLKTSPTGSKDTGIFFPQELIDFLGSNEKYSFRIYKEDCAKAMATIISALPLYSNKGGNKVTHSKIYDETNRLMSMITSFFGNNDSAIYSGFYLSQTTGGRRYLYGLEQKGFSIRKFLVADHSILKFQIKDDGSITLRFQTKMTPTQYDSDEDFIPNLPKDDDTDNDDKQLPLQQIYYGAPGTGKSHKTNEVTSKYLDTVRTTFHPDSDYSTFVGAYKPTMTKVRKAVVIGQDEKEVKPLDGNSEWEEKIAYKFVKQAFLKAYVKAWKKFAETYVEGGELAPQYLVIEEINRGNCAQIFGDLFQLLDRKQDFSEYPIEADADICKTLLEEDTKENPSFGAEGLQLTDEQKTYINNVYDGKPVAEKICRGEVLVLPSNLYILATMNTSDQSLFPIDSAFKRRWEWKYMKIKEGYKTDKQGKKIPLGWKIEIKGEDKQVKLTQDWWAFIQKINAIIASMTSSADKQLGYFFCKADKNGVINGETFVSKVIFYLWNDVFKDYGFEDASLFRYKVKEGDKEVEKDLTFPDFYDEDGENVNAERLVDFIQKVMDWQKPEDNA